MIKIYKTLVIVYMYTCIYVTLSRSWNSTELLLQPARRMKWTKKSIKCVYDFLQTGACSQWYLYNANPDTNHNANHTNLNGNSKQ